MTCTIEIYGPMSMIKGDFPFKEVRKATSYMNDGAVFSRAFKKGLWDGRTHLMNKKTNAFPTGLLNYVTEVLVEHEVDYVVSDHRTVPIPASNGLDLCDCTLRDYQLAVCQDAIKHKKGIIKVATGGGKCLGVNEKVVLFDGSLKAAKDIQVGDDLLGPDSLPRKVKSTCSGTSPMYKITPVKGDSWTCNDVHVLTLVNSKTGNIIDIPLNEYLKKNKTFKHLHKQFHSDAVDFDYSDEGPLGIDSYFLGIWLGDGTKRPDTVAVTTADDEVKNYLKGVAINWGLQFILASNEDRCPTYRLSSKDCNNPLLKEMQKLLDYDDLRIPKKYLCASKEIRMELLAGLIDSDGYLHRKGFEIVQKRERLTDDIAFLCRSLGFKVLKSVKTVNDEAYFRLSIVGNHAHEVPVLLERKKAQPRLQKKNPLRTGFIVEELGEGDYAGFTLEGDGRFLLGDFTVTHNTVMCIAITKDLRLNTLFLVTSKELLYQAEAEFRERLGLTGPEIGLVGDGHWDPGSWITIAIIDTLHSRLGDDDCKELLQSTDVLFADECHGVGADQYYDIAVNCPAYYRFACSGTPYDRTDSAGLRLIGAFGHAKIANVTTKYLVDRGFLPRAQIIFDRVAVPVLKKGTAYPTAYKKGVVENEALQAKVISWVTAAHKAGLSTLILIEEINHGRLLDEALWGAEEFIPHMFVHGTEKDRTSILQDFSDRKLPVLISSSILDVGVSIDSIDCLVLAGSKKSKIKTVQRIGRGLRGDKLVVVEFANFTNKHLLKHSMTRLQDYKGEECFDIHQSKEPSTEFIKKLYDLSDRNLRSA